MAANSKRLASSQPEKHALSTGYRINTDAAKWVTRGQQKSKLKVNDALCTCMTRNPLSKTNFVTVPEWLSYVLETGNRRDRKLSHNSRPWSVLKQRMPSALVKKKENIYILRSKTRSQCYQNRIFLIQKIGKEENTENKKNVQWKMQEKIVKILEKWLPL